MFNQPETYETMEGTSQDGDRELTVIYEVHCWSEGEPYGDTVAYQRHSEILPRIFRLDGLQITYAEMLEIFGKDRFEELMNEAME